MVTTERLRKTTKTPTRSLEAIKVGCQKLAADLKLAFSRIRAPLRIKTSEWSAKHARTKDGGQYVPWPYQRGILDEKNNPKTKKLTVMKSARTGYSQIITIWLAEKIVNDPGHILLYLPTIQKAEEFSKEYIEPMLSWPVMKSLNFRRSLEVKSGDTILVKKFPGGDLKALGGNSPNSFRGHDGDDAIIDEADGFPQEAGKDGDPMGLIEKRLEQSHDPKNVAGSTPTEESTSTINARFEESDKRFYKVQCMTCLKHQRLVWGERGKTGIQWAPETMPSKAWYQCENGCTIEEKDKWEIQERGFWEAEHPEVYEATGHAGFHISTLYSFQPNADWLTLTYEFLEKRKHPAKLKTFVNTTLGEVWKVRGDTPNWKRLEERAEERPDGVVPWGACFLTCGIDVQAGNGGRIEVHVYGWGYGVESFLVERIELAGSPWEQAVWDKLFDVVHRKWKHANGTMMGIHRGALDLSYATMQGYKFCRKVGVGWILPVRGASKGNLLAPPIAESTPIDITLDKGVKKNAARVHVVGTHSLKQELYGFLNLEKPSAGAPHPMGFVHLHTGVGAEFFQQLVAEDFIAERAEWVKRRANEALDCWVYGRAAAIHAGADKWTDAEWTTLQASFSHPDTVEPAVPEPPSISQAMAGPVAEVRREPEPEQVERPSQQYAQPRKKSWLRG